MKLFLFIFLITSNAQAVTCLQAKSDIQRLRKKELSDSDKALYLQNKSILDAMKVNNNPTQEQIVQAIEAKRITKELEEKLLLTNDERATLSEAVSKIGNCWNLNQ